MPSATSVNTKRLLRCRRRGPDTLPSAPIIEDAYPTPNGFIAILKRTANGISNHGISQIIRYEYSLTGATGSWISDALLTSVMPATGINVSFNYSGYYTPGDKVSAVVSGVTKQYLCVTPSIGLNPLYDSTGQNWLPLDRSNDAKYVPLGDTTRHASAFLSTPTHNTAYTVRVRAVTSVGNSISSLPFNTVQAGPVLMVGDSYYTQRYTPQGTKPSTAIYLNTIDLQNKYGYIPDSVNVRMGAYGNCLSSSVPSPLGPNLTYYLLRCNKTYTVGNTTRYVGTDLDSITAAYFSTYPSCLVVLVLQQQAGKHWPGWSQEPDYNGILAGTTPEPWGAFVYTHTA